MPNIKLFYLRSKLFYYNYKILKQMFNRPVSIAIAYAMVEDNVTIDISREVRNARNIHDQEMYLLQWRKISEHHRIFEEDD